jgi:hypothetical protein
MGGGAWYGGLGATEILEYCDPSEMLTREKYFFDLLLPEYKILKEPGSPLGYKHTEETRLKMIGNSNGKNQPNAIKIEVNYLELGGGSASPLKLLIILWVKLPEP